MEEKFVRFSGFDILKFLCAFLVVCIHCPFPGIVGQYFTALARIAVPIFFMITGFFYLDIVNKHRQGQQIKKIFIYFALANFFYLVWKSLLAVVSGTGISAWFVQTFSVKNIINFIVFNESPFNGHLWYLGALLYVLLIMVVVYRSRLNKIFCAITPLLLLGDLIFGKYSLFVLHREFPYIVVRNFFFVGLPYFCIGIMLRKYKGIVKTKTFLLLSILFSLTTLLERYLLVSADLNATRDQYISTTLLSITVFMFFREFYQKRSLSKVEQVFAKVGREYSVWVYIIHPVFITILSVLMGKCGLYNAYQFIAPIIVYFVSIVFVSVMCIIIKKIKQAV